MKDTKHAQYVIRNEMAQLFNEPGFCLPNARWLELQSQLREVESAIKPCDHSAMNGYLVDH